MIVGITSIQKYEHKNLSIPKSYITFASFNNETNLQKMQEKPWATIGEINN